MLVSASRHAEELALRLSGAASCTRELGMEMIKYGRFQVRPSGPQPHRSQKASVLVNV